MNKHCPVVLIAVMFWATSLPAQTTWTPTTATTPDATAIWRPSGGAAMFGQYTWRPEPRVSSRAPQTRPRDCARPQPTVVFVDIGPRWNVYYDPVIYQERQDYYQPGYQWGTGLRENNLAWADFVPYLEEYLLMASPNAQWAFRQGFVEGFGGNGAETYDRFFRQAARPG